MSTLPPRFDGNTFDESQDAIRLTKEFDLVRGLMLDGEWRTLGQIAWCLSITGKKFSEAGISARLRDLRKERFGGYTVERRRAAGGGTFEYRVVTNG